MNPEVFEPERYELHEGPRYTFQPTRREFGAGLLLGAGLMITVRMPALGAAPETIGARLHVGDNGKFTVLSGKVEFGQGSRSELAMAAAEELGVGLDKVSVVLGDTGLCPNDGITAGSRTTPATVPAVRKAAAAARQLMSKGSVAMNTPLPADVTLTRLEEWKILGTPHGRTDAREFVTGRHRYTSDMTLPGMLYGCVVRPPAYGATLKDVSLAPAKERKNVIAVRDGAFAGCAAPTSFEARQAATAMAATASWERQPHVSSKELFQHLKATAQRPREQAAGVLAEGLEKSARRVKAVYRVPYIQHAPMEPRAALAEWKDGSLTVWTGTQNPFGVRDQLAEAFRLDAAKIRVIVPDTGGGFGGKHTGEVAIEAARLAREAGKPVKLRWTRGEEFTWAYFRPAGLFEIEAGVDIGGRLQAWDFANYNAGAAALQSPYRSASHRTRFFPCDSPLREGSYRGIAATANNFAREAFLDEVSATAGMDPLEFRLANLENGRLRDVLTAAADRFGWKTRKKGSGIGIACGTEKGSYVAACAEVAEGKLRSITMAYECGAILNPLNLRAQVEGAIVQGLGGALLEEVNFENGQQLNAAFAKYPVPRFRDVPNMDVVLVNRKDLVSVGAGETPIIAVAPAIANALFDATGKRYRSLPLTRPEPAA